MMLNNAIYFIFNTKTAFIKSFCIKKGSLYVQVLLMLTTDLESDEDKDRAALDLFLTTVIKELDLSGEVNYYNLCFIFLSKLSVAAEMFWLCTIVGFYITAGFTTDLSEKRPL